MSPAEVEACHPWEFNVAVAGWKAAHCGEAAPPPPTDAEHDELVRKYG